MTPKDVKSRAEIILGLCRTVNGFVGEFGSEKHRLAQDKFWDAVTALDKEVSEEIGSSAYRCVSGRLLRFAVGDGYAYYIIEKVLKNTVKVIHLPIEDAYKATYVNRDGEADKMTVEDMIKWTDELAEAAKSAQA